jgi:hypothetical protein
VRVVLTEEEKKFSIEVGDEVPVNAVGAAPGAPGGSATEEAGDESQMGLAVISGLVDDVEVLDGERGGIIRMSWPTVPDADADALA